MNFEKKVEYFVKDMERRNESERQMVPVFFRLIWKMGIKVPPPLFASFMQNTIVIGGCFFVVWVLVTMFLQNLGYAKESGGYLFIAVSFFAFGLGGLMAVLWKKKREMLELPEWEDYPDSPFEAYQPEEESED